MRISNIFALCLLAIFILAGGTMFYILKYHSFKRLDQAEIEVLHKMSTRLVNGIEERLEKNCDFTKDSAEWDDSYVFMTDRNEEYITSNFTQEMMQDSESLGVIFLTTSFTEFFSYCLDNKKDEFRRIIETIIAYKKLIGTMLAEDHNLVVLYEPNFDLFFAVAIYAITPTDKSKPYKINGYFCTISAIDDSFFEVIRQTSSLPISFYNRPDNQDMVCSTTSYDGRFCNRVHFQSDETAALHIILNDAEKKNTMYITAEIKRSLHLSSSRYIQNPSKYEACG